MLHRQRFEVEYAEIFEKFKYGTTIWGPVAGGLLTGRYLSNDDKEGRFSNFPEMWKSFSKWPEYFASEDKLEKTKKLMEGLADIAKELGGNMA